MSLPPVQIRIKRKADEEPVDVLHIHHGPGAKRQRGPEPSFIFSRQPSDIGPASSPIVPQPRRIKQLNRSASSQALGSSSQSSSQEDLLKSTLLAQHDQTATPPKSPFSPAHTPRRFHMSRPATPVGGKLGAGAGQKRKDQAIFVERRIRPRSSEGETNTPLQTETPPPQTSQNGENKSGPGFPSTEMETDTARKKPGTKQARTLPSKSTPPPNVAPLRNVRLPSGEVIPWDISSTRLAAEMQAYTLAEIGRTLAEQEAERPKPNPVSHTSKETHASKFKPKVPAMRYAERHPEARSVGEVEEPAIQDEDTDMDLDLDDEDGEYIIDTYVRIPAEALQDEEQKNFGLLVLESQPDIDEFYREEEDSEEEDIDEEEDENAENHYTADYPDEEVASDDEYDLNAYHYRTGNASDLEEYDEFDDEDGMLHSDDEGDSTRYPWRVKPWMKRPEKSILDDGVEGEKEG